MSRQISEAAKAAKMIKAQLKEWGIKCSAKSSQFSMGDSVDITVWNQPPETMEKLKNYTGQFQYGHFDGMTDMYEHSNSRKDIPQTKYCHIKNEFSDEMRQAAWDWVRENYNRDEAAELPKDYKDLEWHHEHCGRPAQQVVRDILSGGMHGWVEAQQKFWETLKSPAPTTPAKTPNGGKISEHTHTKKNFKMFIVELSERVSRDDFKALLESARELGGWYSRKWGQTPAGFAFKDKAMAQQFLAGGPTMSESEGTDETAPTQKPKPPGANPEKLRALADKMQGQIDNKMADRLTNTPKRVKEANAARQEGQRLERAQKLLFAIADHIEAGTLPEVLADIKTKKRAVELMASKMELCENGFHSYYIETGEPAGQDPQTLAAWELIGPQAKDPNEEINRKIQAVQFSKIPGFFPTPEKVADKMVALADIGPGDSVLEPSAGTGVICRAVRNAEPLAQITAFEKNLTLSEILEGLQFNATNGDFLKMEMPNPATPYGHQRRFCKILMNPPFEQQQDIDHITHAFNHWLADGGRLVAICAESVFFRTTPKNQQFNKLMDEHLTHMEKLEAGTFKNSGTNVVTRIIVLEK